MKLVPAVEIPDDQLLDAVNSSFERAPKSLEWFRWKHREGPWGPSTGVAAVDAGGAVVGVRLFLPWLVRSPDGNEMRIERAMDGAVVPSARRQGLFSRLVEEHLGASGEDQRTVSVVYSTSVPASRDAYIKLGWYVFEEPHYLSPVRPSVMRIRRHKDSDVPNHAPMLSKQGWQTCWDPDSLRWRIDPRSAHDYQIYSTESSDGTSVAIMRKATMKGVPVAVVVHQSGSGGSGAQLAHAAAVRMGCLAVLSTEPDRRPRWAGRVVGGSTVSVWANTPELLQEVGVGSAWCLSFADIEGVM